MTILNTIKERLGIFEEDESYDSELSGYIFSAIQRLYSVGTPVKEVTITKTTTLEDIAPLNTNTQHMCMEYIFLYTKTLFDPPQNRAANTIESLLDELLWRVNIHND